MWKYILVLLFTVGFVSPAFAGVPNQGPVLPQEPCRPCRCGPLQDALIENNIVAPLPQGCIETVCRNTDAVCLCGWTVNKPHPMGTHTKIVDCIDSEDGIIADCDGYGVVIPQTECRRFCDCDGGFPGPPPIPCYEDDDCDLGECVNGYCQDVF